MEESVLDVAAVASAVTAQSGRSRHDVALICGSGFSRLIERLPGAVRVDLSAAGLRSTSAPGHQPAVYSAQLGDVTVLVFAGRSHLYEGVSPKVVTEPVRAAAACGAWVLVQTNAAAALDPALTPGQFVRVADHVNLTGQTPLEGSNFISMVDAYDPELRELAATVDPYQAEVVYGGVRGPAFETAAEVRAYQAMGISVVGFSTVCETLAARASGLRVAAFSLVTAVRSSGFTSPPVGDPEGTREYTFEFLTSFMKSIPVETADAWDLDPG